MSLEQRLADLRQRDLGDLVREKDEIDRTYKALPATVQQVSDLSGIAPELLVRLCFEAGWHSDTKWYKVLDMLRSFYLGKQRIEKEGK